MHNKGIINNNYERLQDLILLFKIPKGMQKNFFKFEDNLGMCPQKSLPAL